ncbi:sensor histidine kinase [Acidihalobacter prosperus]|uniref:histidine kinase n=1 Tax=Acidihalobacter prosperus TaxID=160660 RepID=A0A1A6C7G5_9GAMM|nr:ATP-binding protein [Acidihalobacter prosperus]OBS10502.1 two-component sensor histidine kinase [Acidihalobacter prosperus]
MKPAAGWTLRSSERIPWWSTLRMRLILSVSLVHVILMGGFIWDAVNEQSAGIRTELESRGHSLVNLMAVASTNALLSEDLASLAEVTGRVRQQPDVAYGLIVDERGEVLASTSGGDVGRPLAAVRPDIARPRARLMRLEEPVRVAGRVVGTVYLGLSTAGMHRELQRIRNEGLLFILAALLIGGGAAWLLSYAITRNLHRLGTAVRRIAGGDLGARVEIRSRDEVGMLAKAFNGMLDSLRETSQAVVREHEKRMDAERLACVGELAASIAHEIRNPLAAVINSVSLIGEPELDADDRNKVRRIINGEAGRLQRILESFLDFSRVRESQLERHDLVDLIDEVITLFAEDPDVADGIEIVRRLDVPQRTAVFDQDQMRQVLWNLMRNAVQAMGGHGRLTVSLATRSPCRLRVAIRDSGEGIAPELLGKVRRPFVSGRKGGTGLGLAIVQRILMQHASVLDIASQPGAGTEVAFELETR